MSIEIKKIKCPEMCPLPRPESCPYYKKNEYCTRDETTRASLRTLDDIQNIIEDLFMAEAVRYNRQLQKESDSGGLMVEKEASKIATSMVRILSLAHQVAKTAQLLEKPKEEDAAKAFAELKRLESELDAAEETEEE